MAPITVATRHAMSGSGKMVVKTTIIQREENNRFPGDGRFVVVAGYERSVMSKKVVIAIVAI